MVSPIANKTELNQLIGDLTCSLTALKSTNKKVQVAINGKINRGESLKSTKKSYHQNLENLQKIVTRVHTYVKDNEFTKQDSELIQKLLHSTEEEVKGSLGKDKTLARNIENDIRTTSSIITGKTVYSYDSDSEIPSIKKHTANIAQLQDKLDEALKAEESRKKSLNLEGSKDRQASIVYASIGAVTLVITTLLLGLPGIFIGGIFFLAAAYLLGRSRSKFNEAKKPPEFDTTSLFIKQIKQSANLLKIEREKFNKFIEDNNLIEEYKNPQKISNIHRLFNLTIEKEEALAELEEGRMYAPEGTDEDRIVLQ
jgi:hypothetical protein